MKRMKNECKIIKAYPKTVFESIGENYPDNLYLAQNKFFYKVAQDNGKGPSNHRYLSVLYWQMENQKNQKVQYASSKEYRDLLSVLNKRAIELAELYPRYDGITYKPQTRLMLGIGGESPYNTILLMTLHQTYGLPYIPATAIKGCLRNYWEQEESKGLSIKKLLGADSEEKANLKGCLVFFDTFPEEYSLAFDSLTPHNAIYFEGKGKEAPSDMENKIPLYIPCVTKDSSFKIHIACTDDEEWEKNSSIIMDSLKNALCEYGVGAKTSFGYGLASNKFE